MTSQSAEGKAIPSAIKTGEGKPNAGEEYLERPEKGGHSVPQEQTNSTQLCNENLVGTLLSPVSATFRSLLAANRVPTVRKGKGPQFRRGKKRRQ